MSKIHYREAEDEDVPRMLDLWREFWPEQPYERHLPGKIRREPDLVLIAERDGEIVGTAIGGFDGWWAWIYRVVVREDMQGQGIGSHLLKQMQHRLKARGADSVGAIVASDNARMQKFLGRLDYKERSNKVFAVGL